MAHCVSGSAALSDIANHEHANENRRKTKATPVGVIGRPRTDWAAPFVVVAWQTMVLAEAKDRQHTPATITTILNPRYDNDMLRSPFTDSTLCGEHHECRGADYYTVQAFDP